MAERTNSLVIDRIVRPETCLRVAMRQRATATIQPKAAAIATVAVARWRNTSMTAAGTIDASSPWGSARRTSCRHEGSAGGTTDMGRPYGDASVDPMEAPGVFGVGRAPPHRAAAPPNPTRLTRRGRLRGRWLHALQVDEDGALPLALL